jgi:mRNA interferase MazF
MENIFDNWNVIKKETDATSKTDIKIRSGEIRWCRFGINIGKEILGKGETFRRPVLILKKFSGDVFLGLPLTTKVHTGDWYYTITHEDIERSLILNQARVLDKKRLEDKLFEISEAELQKIKEAYCILIMKP